MQATLKKRLGWIVAGIIAAYAFSLWWDALVVNYRSAMRTEIDFNYLVRGINDYHAAYGRYPIPASSAHAQGDQKVAFSSALMDCLLGKDVDGLNPRHLAFELNGIGGRVGMGSPRPPLDRWGHPYVVVMDTNEDGKLDNPDAKNTSPAVSQGAPPVLETTVQAYSLGADGIEGTEDDIPSRHPQRRSSRENTWAGVSRYGFAGPMLAIASIGFLQFCVLIREVGRALKNRLWIRSETDHLEPL